MSHDGNSDDDFEDFDPAKAPSFSPTTWHGKVVVPIAQGQQRGMPVQNSDDLTRVLNLPRRAVVSGDSPTAAALVELQMRKFSRGFRPPVNGRVCPCGCGQGCNCAAIDKRIASGKRKCLVRLKWEQAWSLHEMHVVGGLVASCPVGLGKCVDPTTEVFDYKTGRRRTVAEQGALRVASFDKTLRVHDATAFPSGQKQCVDVRIADGTDLVASTDHPILTPRGWVEASQLTLEDFVAVAVEMPEPEVHTHATDAEVEFVAFMLSDGGCSSHTLTFTNANNEVISAWEKASRALGYNITEHPSKSKAREFRLLIGRERSKTGPGHYIRVEDKVRDRWSLHGLARHKRAHADIWGLPREQIALFLNRFWACDGHVSIPGAQLEITLASEDLINDIRFLLLRLGIRSRKSFKQASYRKNGIRKFFDAWRLSICGASAERFLQEVGDVLGKEIACQTLRQNLKDTKRNTNNDVVPIGPKEIIEICDELGPRVEGKRTEIARWFGVTKGQHVSRSKFLRFCSDYNYSGKHAHLATTDVAWERVRAVRNVGIRDVYDLNVPGTHNFVANGVVIHNTLLNVVAPLALRDCKLALLLIPSSLRKQITTDYQLIAEHFHTPTFVVHFPGNRTWKSELKYQANGTPAAAVHVVPYNYISDERRSQWIESLQPDAIICDEVDALSDMESSRTMRVMRYFSQYHATTRFCGWTGSLTDSAVSEFAHLYALALRYKSPLPLDHLTIEEWGRCLDAVLNPVPPGALVKFLAPGEGMHEIRKAFHRRLADTPGIIMIGGRQIIRTDAGEEVLNDIREKVAPKLPPRVQEALKLARDNLRPDSLVSDDPDEILNDPLEQARVVRQVATGVFYRWKWDGIPRELALKWLAARKAWNSELRWKMLQGELHLDSAKLCENAARRAYGELPNFENLPVWRAENWPAWRDIKDACNPKTEARWLDEWLVEDAAEWCRNNRGIIWYGMVEFAQKLAKLTGLKVYGDNSEKQLEECTGEETIICSIKSHGRGRNGLQFLFDQQCVINTLASARMYQQLLGRLRRDGQQSAVVETEIYLQTSELRQTLEQALRRGEYVQDMTTETQMLIDGWHGYARSLYDC